LAKILITGNSGYIGSYLSEYLLKNTNHQLHGLDIVPAQVKLATQYIHDIRDPMPMYLPRYDVVIHLAAQVKVGESTSQPWSYYETNLIGTKNALAIPGHFIFASTGAAANPISPYAISKLAAEALIAQRAKYTTFRFYNVLGGKPTNEDGLMYNLMEANRKHQPFTIHGSDYNTRDGTAIRDYIHIHQLCEAISKAITTPANRIEHLSSGNGYTVKEVVEAYQRVNNCKFEVIYSTRRNGDAEIILPPEQSKYLPNPWSIEECLKSS
jgi:UDP-glucose 4-epimerase